VYPVYSDWLENLLKPFIDPAVALVYGKQRGGLTAKYSEEQIFKKWFPESSDTYQKHPFCNNANCAVRKSLWMQMPYDETLAGLEDLDWAKRVVRKGYKIAYSSDAEIVHIHNETLLNIYNRYRREAIALKTIYPQEWFNFWTFMRLMAGNCLSDYYHSIRERVFWRNFAAIFLFRLTQFWGTYCGYLQTGQISGQLRDKFYYPNGFRRSCLPAAYSRSARRIEYSAVAEEERCSCAKFD
jgi:GT2 family glycosyltransferase